MFGEQLFNSLSYFFKWSSDGGLRYAGPFDGGVFTGWSEKSTTFSLVEEADGKD